MEQITNVLIAGAVGTKQYEKFLEELFIYCQSGYLYPMAKFVTFTTEPKKAHLIGATEKEMFKQKEKYLEMILPLLRNQENWVVNLFKYYTDYEAVQFIAKIFRKKNSNNISKRFRILCKFWDKYGDPQPYIDLIVVCNNVVSKTQDFLVLYDMALLATNAALRIINKQFKFKYRRENAENLREYADYIYNPKIKKLKNGSDKLMHEKYIEIAAYLGDPKAMIKRCYQLCMIPNNSVYIREAFILAQHAWEEYQYKPAAHRLGLFYSTGSKGLFEQDIDKAIYYFKQDDSDDAKTMLGHILKDEEKIKYYQASDTSESHLHLAREYLRKGDNENLLKSLEKIYFGKSEFVVENFTMLYFFRQKYGFDRERFVNFLMDTRQNEDKKSIFFELLSGFLKHEQPKSCTEGRDEEYALLYEYCLEYLKNFKNKQVSEKVFRYLEQLPKKYIGPASYNIAVYYRKLKDKEKSTEFLRISTEAGYKDSIILYLKNLIGCIQKNYQSDVIREIIKYGEQYFLKCTDSMIAYNMGVIYKEIKPSRLDKSVCWFKVAWSLGDVRALYYLALNAQQQKNYKEADKYFRICVEKKYEYSYYAYGLLLKETGKINAAINHFKMVETLANKEDSCYEVIILTQQKGDLEETEFYLDVYSSFLRKNESPERKKVIKYIENWVCSKKFKINKGVKNFLHSFKDKRETSMFESISHSPLPELHWSKLKVKVSEQKIPSEFRTKILRRTLLLLSKIRNKNSQPKIIPLPQHRSHLDISLKKTESQLELFLENYPMSLRIEEFASYKYYADQGDIHCCMMTATYYYEGYYPVEQDNTRALLYFSMAARNGNWMGANNAWYLTYHSGRIKESKEFFDLMKQIEYEDCYDKYTDNLIVVNSNKNS